MANQGDSRFTPQNQSTNDRLSNNTVGLVALSDFRKRRAEVLEQQEREAREARNTGTGTGTSTPPDRSQTGTPDIAGSDATSGAPGSQPLKKRKKKQQQQDGEGEEVDDRGDPEEDHHHHQQQPKLKTKTKLKKPAKKLLSFDDDDENGDEDGDEAGKGTNDAAGSEGGGGGDAANKPKFKVNTSVAVIPKVVTKAALRKEATEREALRREFVAIQEAVKATEIAIPFVFYDGANTPGGTVRMKKGDFVWAFLDRGRKVGAERRVGDHATARRAWARASVDDLMLVRDTVIIPHHYDFYYFVLNKSTGPGGQRLFNYSAEAPTAPEKTASSDPSPANTLSTAESRAAAAKTLADITTLEGAGDEPTKTKVVDRRWYSRNKHIYPASTWQAFDPEKDYVNEIRKDTGGNTYFFGR